MHKISININGEQREMPGEITVDTLLQELGLSRRQVAVELNLKLIPRESHRTTSVSNGDQLEIVTLAGGG